MFAQLDPIGFEAGDVNLYRYVWNNPANYIDPLGLEKCTVGAVRNWQATTQKCFNGQTDKEFADELGEGLGLVGGLTVLGNGPISTGPTGKDMLGAAGKSIIDNTIGNPSDHPSPYEGLNELGKHYWNLRQAKIFANGGYSICVDATWEKCECKWFGLSSEWVTQSDRYEYSSKNIKGKIQPSDHAAAEAEAKSELYR